MGRMNDLSLQRDEWREQLIRDVKEMAIIVETPEPEWFMVKLEDGVQISLVDDCEYVDATGAEFWLKPIECDPAKPEERAAAIAKVRLQIKYAPSNKE